jgi:hypothetical protein
LLAVLLVTEVETLLVKAVETEPFALLVQVVEN